MDCVHRSTSCAYNARHDCQRSVGNSGLPGLQAGARISPEPESLKCTQCRRVYPVKDDIPIMLVDEATIERPRRASYMASSCARPSLQFNASPVSRSRSALPRHCTKSLRVSVVSQLRFPWRFPYYRVVRSSKRHTVSVLGRLNVTNDTRSGSRVRTVTCNFRYSQGFMNLRRCISVYETEGERGSRIACNLHGCR